MPLPSPPPPTTRVYELAERCVDDGIEAATERAQTAARLEVERRTGLIDSYLGAHSAAIDVLRSQVPDFTRDMPLAPNALRPAVQAVRDATRSLAAGEAVEFSIQPSLMSTTAAFVCEYEQLVEALVLFSVDTEATLLVEQYARVVDRYNRWQDIAHPWTQQVNEAPLWNREYRRWRHDPNTCELDICQCEAITDFTGSLPVSSDCGAEDPDCE